MVSSKLRDRIGICNIHLVEVDQDCLDHTFLRRGILPPTVGMVVWVCGRHGADGVLNDGVVVLWDESILALLDRIKNLPVEECSE